MARKKMVDKKLVYSKAGLIDRVPDQNIKSEEIVNWIINQKQYMTDDRQAWLQRQDKYLNQWDDYLTYPRKGLWDESSNLHMPLTMQMCKALHARIKQALFAIHLPYNTIPLEKLDIERLKTIDICMRWAIYNYANYYKGIVNTIDDWIWDIVTVGWGVLKRRWDRIERKAIVLEEIKQDVEAQQAVDEVQQLLMEQLNPESDKFNEVMMREVPKIIPYFDGPVVETVAHEDIWFPGRWQDVSDLNEPLCVFQQFDLTKSQVESRIKAGIYEEKAGQIILEKGVLSSLSTMDDAQTKKQREDETQGVESVNSSFGGDKYRMVEGYCRYDVDGDGIDEEIVVTINEDTRQLARWTYLDRITKTGKRPFHKADLIRRPRRAYSIGLIELLYPINNEVDSMHNMRVDTGTITNVPFFFYRATCGLKPEKIKLEPGVGIPLDDPNADISFPKFNQMTNFGTQEEMGLIQWAERLTSLTSMNMGMPSPTVGASRTAAGMQALLNEGNLNIDIILDRVKVSYAEYLKGLLADLQERLPDDTLVRVCGGNGETLYQNGSPWILKPTRQEIAGRVDFIITANSQNTNRELEKANAVMYSQLLLNPINLQTGIIQPNNVYHIMKNILDKNGVLNPEDFITKPESVPTPLSIYDEIAAVTQGMVPTIVMNDNHKAKIQGLMMWSQEPVFIAGIKSGVNSPKALEALNLAVQAHVSMQAAIEAQAAPAQNVTGMQTSPTAGADMAALKGGNGGQGAANTAPAGAEGNAPVGGNPAGQGGGGQPA